MLYARATRLTTMKRHLRLCLIFLIGLTLPFVGMAGLQAPVEPCPMQVSDMATMANTMDMTPDCCEDMGSPAEHGKPCKTGQECKTASLLQVTAIKPPVPLSAPVAMPDHHDLLPERSPSGPWRPPRV